MNLPNKLTLARMILAPIYFALILAEFNHHFIIAAAVFGVAALTDFLDGMLARKNNQITVFGKLLDPIGDKMLCLAALLGFLKFGMCSSWVVMIVFSREFVITSIRMIAVEQGQVIAANIWGKVKTASQMIFTIIIMILAEFSQIFDGSSVSVELISNILMWIIAFLTAVSGIKYCIDASKSLDISK